MQKTELQQEGTGSSLYQVFGGRVACRKLSAAFYGYVERDPLLRPFFPGKSFKCAIEEFTAFLAQLLGGPGADSQRRWWLSLRESHMRFKIGPEERTAWLANMVRAIDDCRIDDPFRAALLAFFQRSSTYVSNQAGLEGVSEDGIDVPEDPIHNEITQHWKAQMRLDRIVAAVRSGDAGVALELAENFDQPFVSKSLQCGLLALMIHSGNPLFITYVRTKLLKDPDLIREPYAGRTLLHEAAAAGNLPILEFLLGLGADPDAHDSGGHTALYCLANECNAAAGKSVVRTLVKAGAAVNSCGGVKRCTPLHMAARRGNEEIANELLDCGAAIDPRDSAGATPLRRAVNCRKRGIVSLLLARGADPACLKAKNLTPQAYG